MTGRGEMFTPSSDEQVGRLAMIEAIRAQTDAVSRLVRAEEARDGKLEAIKDQLSDMKLTIGLLQNNSPEAKIEALIIKVAALEAINERNRGERGAIAAVFNSKALAWIVAGLLAVAAWLRGAFH